MTEPREALAAALNAFLTPEQLGKLVDEVLAIEKRISAEHTCKHCGRVTRGYVSVPDAKAVALALPDLLNQAYGRPQEASAALDPIVFKRVTITDDDEAVSKALREVDKRRKQQKQRETAAAAAPGNGGSEEH
jgi:hypothetical protein